MHEVGTKAQCDLKKKRNCNLGHDKDSIINCRLDAIYYHYLWSRKDEIQFYLFSMSFITDLAHIEKSYTVDNIAVRCVSSKIIMEIQQIDCKNTA